MAVGGIGMICTANYVARTFGVRSAMPGFIAKKLCPQVGGGCCCLPVAQTAGDASCGSTYAFSRCSVLTAAQWLITLMWCTLPSSRVCRPNATAHTHSTPPTTPLPLLLASLPHSAASACPPTHHLPKSSSYL